MMNTGGKKNIYVFMITLLLLGSTQQIFATEERALLDSLAHSLNDISRTHSLRQEDKALLITRFISVCGFEDVQTLSDERIIALADDWFDSVARSGSIESYVAMLDDLNSMQISSAMDASNEIARDQGERLEQKIHRMEMRHGLPFVILQHKLEAARLGELDATAVAPGEFTQNQKIGIAAGATVGAAVVVVGTIFAGVKYRNYLHKNHRIKEVSELLHFAGYTNKEGTKLSPDTFNDILTYPGNFINSKDDCAERIGLVRGNIKGQFKKKITQNIDVGRVKKFAENIRDVFWSKTDSGGFPGEAWLRNMICLPLPFGQVAWSAPQRPDEPWAQSETLCVSP